MSSFAGYIILIVANWKIFVKAGKPGWAILIPIYNVIIMLQIVKKPWWWFLLMLIPIVNVVIVILVIYNFVKVFGKPGWHVLLALFLSIIYYPYIAFSDAPDTWDDNEGIKKEQADCLLFKLPRTDSNC